MKVAVLGPRYSNSDEVGRRTLKGYDPKYVGSLFDVIPYVESGQCEIGIFPHENTKGPINEHVVQLFRTDLNVFYEVESRIHHALAGNRRSRRIITHPQARKQCEKYIGLHFPRAHVIEASSTSEAANRAKKEECMAICSEKAARGYDIRILDRNIEDHEGNSTRFWIISKRKPKIKNIKKERDRSVSLFCEIRNKSNSLVDGVVGPFANLGINLELIETYKKDDNTSYFYLRYACENKLSVETALKMVKSKALYLQVLGPYERILLS